MSNIKLGCKVMRVQYLLSPKALGRLAPYAEEYGIEVGVEIHNPETPTTPIVKEYIEVIKESGSKFIGLIPDFGCFATKPNKPHWDGALAAGASGPIFMVLEGMYGFVQFRRDRGLEGFIVSEYEANIHAVYMVKRHIAMENRILGI